jgi:putative phage-type endonuclease
MIEQGSIEWKQARLGRVTASRVADVIAKTKTGVSASRANYEAQIICERLTGVVVEGYTNAAMQHGIDTEPQARAAYEFMRNVDVVLASFVDHPRVPMSGASPDGFVDDDGLIEIKAPQPAAHLETLLSQAVPTKYVTQMMWQMGVTGRKWCDYVSFSPAFPAHLQLFVKRVPRDEKVIAELEKEVLAFLAEVDRKVALLQPMEKAA